MKYQKYIPTGHRLPLHSYTASSIIISELLKISDTDSHYH